MKGEKGIVAFWHSGSYAASRSLDSLPPCHLFRPPPMRAGDRAAAAEKSRTRRGSQEGSERGIL